MKQTMHGRLVRVQDMDRLCYICDKNNKVRVLSGGKMAVLDEYCLVCDLDGLEKFVRGAIREKSKFKLELPEEKKKAFESIMIVVVNRLEAEDAKEHKHGQADGVQVRADSQSPV